MSILLIGSEEEQAIAKAIEIARVKPIPLAVGRAIASGDFKTTVLLGDRKIGVEVVRQMYAPQQVMLGTYRCAVSFEEQPLGLMRHLSVSTRKGKVPGPEVMMIVLEAFGFSSALRDAIKAAFHGDGESLGALPALIWNEEFEPGWFAINVTELEP